MLNWPGTRRAMRGIIVLLSIESVNGNVVRALLRVRAT
jgi:hypothetical protein